MRRLSNSAFLARALAITTITATTMGIWSCGRADETPSRASVIIGENNLEMIEAAIGTPLYRMAQSVARVRLGSYLCTGFRVANDLFITNHHCYEGTTCESTKFIMGLEEKTPVDQQKTYNCKKVISYNQTLDYSLYQVTVNPGDEALDRYPIVTLSRQRMAKNQRLFIAGYPHGNDFKRMDRSANCVIVEPSAERRPVMGYSCDTDSGSSGSSVFDYNTGHVVGLHWGNSQVYNRATVMNFILDDIKTKSPEQFARLTVVN